MMSRPVLQSTLLEAVVLDPEDANPEDSEDEKGDGDEDAPMHDEKADETIMLGEPEADVARAPRGWRIDTFEIETCLWHHGCEDHPTLSQNFG